MNEEKAEKKQTGPEPERLAIDMEFEDAIDTALEKKRPEGGWPKGGKSTGLDDQ